MAASAGGMDVKNDGMAKEISSNASFSHTRSVKLLTKHFGAKIIYL